MLPPSVFRFSRARALQTAALAMFVSALVSGTMLRGAEQAESPAPATSVWDGVFTETQAERGRNAYLANCAACHGENLQGREHKALRGDRFWVDWQDTTVDYLLGQISRNMPFTDDGSLAGTLGMGTYLDIVAHILRENEFPSGGRELTEGSSAGVHIVPRDGPGQLPAGSFVHVVGCLSARGADRNWRLQQGSPPARIMTDSPVDTDAALGDREYTLMFVLTSLDKYVGHRMSVRGSLMGEGGADGLNVTSVESMGDACE